MVTDPPYGVEYDASWRTEVGINAPGQRPRVGKVSNDDRIDWTSAWDLFGGNVIYCWHAGRHAGEVQRSLESAGFQIRSQIIWAKRNFAISRGAYHWMHEPCWYAVRKGTKASWRGGRKQTTVWDDITLDANVVGGHSTQKPVALMARSIANHAGDVYDPFAGSGTSLIAAETLGRRCLAAEIEPRYCDVIVLRWEQFTGRRASVTK